MELVEGNARIGQMLAHSLDECWRHVDRDGFDGLWITAMASQIFGKGHDRVGATLFGDMEHLAFIGIGEQVDGVVPLGARGLIDGQAVVCREIGLGQRQIDVTLTDGGNTMPRQIDQRATAANGISLHRVMINASNRRVKPASLPTQSRSTSRILPSGRHTRGMHTSR